MKNYYVILQVDPKSTLEAIKRAYRRLAKRYHPDKRGLTGSAANEEQFKEISEAYETLRDPEKRREYDKKLEHSKPKRAGFGTDFHRSREGFRRAQASPALSADIILSQEELLRGGSIPVEVPIQVECPYCFGFGNTFFFRCPECGGTGVIRDGHRMYIDIPLNVQHGDRVRYRLSGLTGLDRIVEFRFLIEW